MEECPVIERVSTSYVCAVPDLFPQRITLGPTTIPTLPGGGLEGGAPGQVEHLEVI